MSPGLTVSPVSSPLLSDTRRVIPQPLSPLWLHLTNIFFAPSGSLFSSTARTRPTSPSRRTNMAITRATSSQVPRRRLRRSTGKARELEQDTSLYYFLRHWGGRDFCGLQGGDFMLVLDQPRTSGDLLREGKEEMCAERCGWTGSAVK